MYDQPTVPRKVEIIPQDKGYLVIWTDQVDEWTCNHCGTKRQGPSVTVRRVAVPDTQELIREIAHRDREESNQLVYMERAAKQYESAKKMAKDLRNDMATINRLLFERQVIRGNRYNQIRELCAKVKVGLEDISGHF